MESNNPRYVRTKGKRPRPGDYLDGSDTSSIHESDLDLTWCIQWNSKKSKARKNDQRFNDSMVSETSKSKSFNSKDEKMYSESGDPVSEVLLQNMKLSEQDERQRKRQQREENKDNKDSIENKENKGNRENIGQRQPDTQRMSREDKRRQSWQRRKKMEKKMKSLCACFSIDSSEEEFETEPSTTKKSPVYQDEKKPISLKPEVSKPVPEEEHSLKKDPIKRRSKRSIKSDDVVSTEQVDKPLVQGKERDSRKGPIRRSRSFLQTRKSKDLVPSEQLDKALVQGQEKDPTTVPEKRSKSLLKSRKSKDRVPSEQSGKDLKQKEEHGFKNDSLLRSKSVIQIQTSKDRLPSEKSGKYLEQGQEKDPTKDPMRRSKRSIKSDDVVSTEQVDKPLVQGKERDSRKGPIRRSRSFLKTRKSKDLVPSEQLDKNLEPEEEKTPEKERKSRRISKMTVKDEKPGTILTTDDDKERESLSDKKSDLVDRDLSATTAEKISDYFSETKIKTERLSDEPPGSTEKRVPEEDAKDVKKELSDKDDIIGSIKSDPIQKGQPGSIEDKKDSLLSGIEKERVSKQSEKDRETVLPGEDVGAKRLSELDERDRKPGSLAKEQPEERISQKGDMDRKSVSPVLSSRKPSDQDQIEGIRSSSQKEQVERDSKTGYPSQEEVVSSKRLSEWPSKREDDTQIDVPLSNIKKERASEQSEKDRGTGPPVEDVGAKRLSELDERDRKPGSLAKEQPEERISQKGDMDRKSQSPDEIVALSSKRPSDQDQIEGKPSTSQKEQDGRDSKTGYPSQEGVVSSKRLSEPDKMERKSGSIQKEQPDTMKGVTGTPLPEIKLETFSGQTEKDRKSMSQDQDVGIKRLSETDEKERKSGQEDISGKRLSEQEKMGQKRESAESEAIAHKEKPDERKPFGLIDSPQEKLDDERKSTEFDTKNKKSISEMLNHGVKIPKSNVEQKTEETQTDLKDMSTIPEDETEGPSYSRSIAIQTSPHRFDYYGDFSDKVLTPTGDANCPEGADCSARIASKSIQTDCVCNSDSSIQRMNRIEAFRAAKTGSNNQNKACQTDTCMCNYETSSTDDDTEQPL